MKKLSAQHYQQYGKLKKLDRDLIRLEHDTAKHSAMRTAELLNLRAIVYSGIQYLAMNDIESLKDAKNIGKEVSSRVKLLRANPDYAGKHEVQKFKPLQKNLFFRGKHIE